MGATSADQGSGNSDCMPGAGPAESGRPISNNQQPTDRCAHHATSYSASGTGQQPTDGTGIAADRSEKSRDAISVPEEWRDRIAAIVLLSAAIQNNMTGSDWNRGRVRMHAITSKIRWANHHFNSSRFVIVLLETSVLQLSTALAGPGSQFVRAVAR